MTTWGKVIASPCHCTNVWLCYRNKANDPGALTWQGVPCTADGCGATYTLESVPNAAGDWLWVPVPNEYPEREDVHFWAIAGDDWEQVSPAEKERLAASLRLDMDTADAMESVVGLAWKAETARDCPP